MLFHLTLLIINNCKKLTLYRLLISNNLLKNIIINYKLLHYQYKLFDTNLLSNNLKLLVLGENYLFLINLLRTINKNFILIHIDNYDIHFNNNLIDNSYNNLTIIVIPNKYDCNLIYPKYFIKLFDYIFITNKCHPMFIYQNFINNLSYSKFISIFYSNYKFLVINQLSYNDLILFLK